MSRCWLLIWALAAALTLSLPASESSAQNAGDTHTSQGEVVMTQLAGPVYPPLARQARIIGDVEVTLNIRQDGSVASVVPISGHPLLIQAALDSAQHSKFECRKCSDAVTPYRMVYSFLLDASGNCSPAAISDASNSQADKCPVRVSQSENHVTLVSPPVGYLCILYGATRVRCLKCFYLWKCEDRPLK
jgi:hypothetical protein